MTFQFDAQIYATHSTHQKDWGQALVESIDFAPNAKILDLGCGDGLLAAQLAQAFPESEVWGLDSCPKMIAWAQEEHQAPNLRFVEQDMEQLDLPRKFDWIISNAAVHWVRDQASLLARAREHLAPEGGLRWNFMAQGNAANVSAVLKHTLAAEPFAPYFEDFVWPWVTPSVASYRQLVSSLGFSVWSVTGQERDRLFPDRASLIGWIDQPCLVPFLPRLPEALRPDFRAQVIEAMVERTRTEEGFREQFRRIDLQVRR